MNNRFIAFLIFILSVSAFARLNTEIITQSGEKNPFAAESLKKIKYPGDSSIDVTYYKLEIVVTSYRNFIYGTTTIGIRSVVNGLNGFYLDFRNIMTVDSIVLDNQKLSAGHTSDCINISLPKLYNKGDLFFVKVYYHGAPASAGNGSYSDVDHGGQRIVWTKSEPYGASDWFPCKDSPGDKADSSDVWVTCQTSMKVVSNGTLQEDKDNGDGTHIVKWKNHYPIAQYLISIACTNYILYTNYFVYSPTDSMPVMHYVYPESFNAQNKALMDKVPAMLKIFSNRFGLYPFIKEKYGQAQWGWGGGMEHQTITSLNGFSETLEAHELAHQWFGDMITCANWQDIWLNEGFSEYFTFTYLEDMYGRKYFNSSFFVYEFDPAKNANGSIYVNNILSTGEIFNSNRTYHKGAAVMHMLRGVVGDSVFYKILRTYAGDLKVAYGSATTADFETIAERVYGQSLKYFFDEWIFGENYPRYRFTWTANDLQSNTYQVNLNISQIQNTNPVFFTMPVQIKIRTELSDTVVTLMNNAQNQDFHISVRGKPVVIIFDEDNWILKDVLTNGVDDKGSSLTSYKLEQNYPNPFNPGTKIRFQIAADKNTPGALSEIILEVFDNLGRKVTTLFDEAKPAGFYEFEFDASKYSLESGVYYYKLTAGKYSETRKMVYLK